MAELNQTISNSGKNRRCLKPLPKVDLTAMVDLAFLLITFFMLTTSLSKPSAMHVAMPVDEGALPVSESRTMTVCLGANDQVLWYIGTTDDPQYIQVTNPSKIRSDFQNQMKEVSKKSGKSLIVLIKPSEKANFKNLVDLLDELEIVKVSSYAIVDITSGDKKMMIERNIY
jgi:biopolymer transport protein ExbD